MKISLSSEELRTGLPLLLQIESKQKPVVFVKGFGKLPIEKTFKGHQSHFWAQKPGEYLIEVTVPGESWKKKIIVKEQKFLSFSEEMGFFLLLFFIVIGILIVWMRKLKKIIP